MPAARMISAERNSGNEATFDAGRNRKAPVAITSSPTTIDCLYPSHSTSFPEGSAKTKYDEKKQNCTSIACA